MVPSSGRSAATKGRTAPSSASGVEFRQHAVDAGLRRRHEPPVGRGGRTPAPSLAGAGSAGRRTRQSRSAPARPSAAGRKLKHLYPELLFDGCQCSICITVILQLTMCLNGVSMVVCRSWSAG